MRKTESLSDHRTKRQRKVSSVSVSYSLGSGKHVGCIVYNFLLKVRKINSSILMPNGRGGGSLTKKKIKSEQMVSCVFQSSPENFLAAQVTTEA